MKQLRVPAMGVLFVLVFSCGVLGQTDKPAAKASPSEVKYQFKIGVLPFVDNTGSGGGDLASALSRAVQAEIAHSTKLQGSVLKLAEGTNPEDVDSDKALEIGRARKVDVVVVGTVLEASSEESDHSAIGPSIGGISIGGSSHSMKAVVTLQGDLYDTTAGNQIDSIRVTKEATQTKVGANVNTSLGDLSNGGASFDSSPIGKALHSAVTELVKELSDEQDKMKQYKPNSASASPKEAPAKSDDQ